MQTLERNLNALIVVILSCILLGAFGVQIFKHEQPCPLCLLQRLGMIGVACGALMNLKFGVRTLHYGLSLLSSLTGGFVAIRQWFLHICPNTPTFGTPFWGLNLYTWSFIIFVSTVTAIALLLIFFRHSDRKMHLRLNGWSFFAFVFMFLIACANAVVTLYLCGLTPCEG